MKKAVELLAPAGSKEALIAAIESGCDAVYLAGQAFGARAFAKNFDEVAMKEAIQYAHRYGVKVYVTVNTLIKDDEMNDCINYVRQLQGDDVDALIIQDIGLLDVLHQQFPDLELHASTQMHIHNKEGLLFLKEMGIQRAVLARETTLKQIQSMSDLGIELEVFVHGAMCVCYSGQCLMSYRLFDRSGNRGACAQPCRMAYELYHRDGKQRKKIPLQDEYLLSLKDMNTLKHIPELLEAGITSFKIEGRMKSPEYVAQTVKAYREAIDTYMSTHQYTYQPSQEKELLKVFNRGFSEGHLFDDNNKRLVNMYRPNHMGVSIGKVISSHRTRMKIKLIEPLLHGDGIRVIGKGEDYGCMVNRMYIGNQLVKSAQAGDIVEVEKNGFVENGATVIKSMDKALLNDVTKALQKTTRKIPITMHFEMKRNQKAKLSVADGTHELHFESEELVEIAERTPLDEMRIRQQLSKCGDTNFMIENLSLAIDDQSTMPIKAINELRRTALQALDEQRQTWHEGRRELSYQRTPQATKQEITIQVFITNEKQLAAAQSLGISELYSSNRKLCKMDEFIHFVEPRVHLQPYNHKTSDSIGELGGLYKHNPQTSELSMNVTNAYTAAFLHDQGVGTILLSPELSISECKAMITNYQKQYHDSPSLGVMVYGRLEMMVTRYCIMSAALAGGNRHCGLCQKPGYYEIEDRKGRVFPILCDDECFMHILDDRPISQATNIQDYLKLGITAFRLQFTIEDEKETITILNQYIKLLNHQ